MQLDLNLLVALDALLEEGSVGGAADRMHLSAPAMSRALSRIRRATGDEILVRTGRSMPPTPRAVAVRDQVHELVRSATALLTPSAALDLTALVRTFSLQLHDAVALTIGPTLVASVQRAAPGAVIRLLAEPAHDSPDLRYGRVDLTLGASAPVSPDVTVEAVGSDTLVIALRRDHPLAGPGLTAETYAGAGHVIVSRRGRLHDPVDEALSARGLRRRVVACVPTSATALRLVTATDLVVAVPSHVCGVAEQTPGVVTLPMPLGLPTVPLLLAWHHRYDDDRAHAWLRLQVRDAVHELLGRTGPAPDAPANAFA